MSLMVVSIVVRLLSCVWSRKVWFCYNFATFKTTKHKPNQTTMKTHIKTRQAQSQLNWIQVERLMFCCWIWRVLPEFIIWICWIFRVHSKCNSGFCFSFPWISALEVNRGDKPARVVHKSRVLSRAVMRAHPEVSNWDQARQLAAVGPQLQSRVLCARLKWL